MDTKQAAIEYLKKLKSLVIIDKDGLKITFYKEFLDKTIVFLQQEQKLRESLIQFLEKENPYPEDVFLPIKKEDFDKIDDLLKKEMGYSIDRLSGSMGRRLYKSIIGTLKEMIK
jgi:hypothetical protein